MSEESPTESGADGQRSARSGGGRSGPAASSSERPADPVAAGNPDADLDGVATWEPRSIGDEVTVGVHRVLAAARRWVLVALGVGLLLADLALTGFLVVDEPLIGLLAALSALPALALVAWVWWLDDARREPLVPLSVTFVLSFVLASIAAVVNTVAALPLDALPAAATAVYFFVIVAPIEEYVKLAAVRTYAYRRPSFDAVVDGAVYGAVAGLGFATVENLSYITQGFLQGAPGTGEPVLIAVGTAATRAFVGPGHVIYSAFAGYYLGLARFNPDRAGPLVLKGLSIAVLIHAVYNTVVTFAEFTLLGLLVFIVVYDGLFALVLVRKLRRYASLYPDEGEGRPDATAE